VKSTSGNGELNPVPSILPIATHKVNFTVAHKQFCHGLILKAARGTLLNGYLNYLAPTIFRGNLESPHNVHVIFGLNRGLNMESKYMTEQAGDQGPGYCTRTVCWE